MLETYLHLYFEPNNTFLTAGSPTLHGTMLWLPQYPVRTHMFAYLSREGLYKNLHNLIFFCKFKVFTFICFLPPPTNAIKISLFPCSIPVIGTCFSIYQPTPCSKFNAFSCNLSTAFLLVLNTFFQGIYHIVLKPPKQQLHST